MTTEQISLHLQRLWSPEVRTLEPYVPGEQPKLDNLLKLNTNESPFPPSPKVAEAIMLALSEQANLGMGSSLRLYPDPDASALKHAIAIQQKLPVEQIFVGNGSDEVLAHIFKAFFIQDKPVLYPDISYSFYPVYSQFFNLKVVEVPLAADFSIDVSGYQQPNGGIVFANPNAPTGVFLPLDKIEVILQQNPDSVVVVDEAYVDFGGQSATCLIDQYDNLVVCQTTSKSRALAGLRIGMAFAQPHLIAALERVKNSFNSYPMDRLAIAGGVASFEDQAYFEQTSQQTINNREQLVAQLTQLGFEVLPSKANFIFTRHQQYSAAEIAGKLRETGIIVRHFNKPKIHNFLRITIGTTAQQQRLIDRLKEVIQ
ncbi:histidinol-phosphate transaminase [Alkanindiges hydrocarboniclasticus]|uniref:Histidinol-phosphate aminotransferase n=1 Tax=Alkanindiges hydrocarboniclasticus TaxID=1907941 RepID=A0A1S8CXF0_9GAMM|nr:histidinol-phosphate transaminase [Alkanindiges hydrocarboniclasticus]ONG42011.1 histidinol-phosphate transaminase [Alkanindiges hydrocarboniclasticus]